MSHASRVSSSYIPQTAGVILHALFTSGWLEAIGEKEAVYILPIRNMRHEKGKRCNAMK